MTDEIQTALDVQTIEEVAVPKVFNADYVEALRREAASRRVEAKQLRTELDTLKPQVESFASVASELKTLKEQLETERQANQLIQKKVKLSALVSKAGLPSGLVDALDLSTFDLTNEEAVLERLQSFGMTRQVTKDAKPTNPEKTYANENDVKPVKLDSIFGIKR